MGLLAQAFNPRPRASVSWSPLDDRWYSNDLVATGASAVALSAETILQCGTVLAAVRFRGDAWAMCPPSTYRISGARRIVDSGHYSHRVLRNPNPWQSGNRWRHLNGVWLATYGNAYNEIIPGRASFADQLVPLHPRMTRVVDRRSDGTLTYETRPTNGGTPRRLGQESVLHFRDIGTDGISGLEMYSLIRNTVSIALLAERHAGTFLRKGARISGLLSPSAPLGKEDRATLRESINEDLGGPNNTGRLGILPHGVDLKPFSQTNKDAEFVALSDQVVGMILRFLGVPGVVVGWQGDKASTYASADAFFQQGGIKHCVLPILTNVEAEEEKALLLPDDGRQIKHNLDALLRANWKDRMEGLTKAVGGPFMAVNEARDIEDLDAIEDPRYDRPHIPSNMEGQGDAESSAEESMDEAPRPLIRPAPDDEEEARARALGRQLALDAAARVVRREISAIRDRTRLAGRDAPAFRAWLVGYYERHASHVAGVMHLSAARAGVYAARQRDAVLSEGLAIVETWEDSVPYQLAAMAWGEE